MSVAAARAAAGELVAAARRDLAEVEAALRLPEEDWDCLVVLVLLTRAVQRADAATFALLDAHALNRNQRKQGVSGVESVEVDLETKRVTVVGDGLDDMKLRAATGEAGYEAARIER